MSFDDIASKLKKQAPKQPAPGEQKLDIDATYKIRAKMIGVLMKDARLNAARTPEECARILRVSVETYMGWEFGQAMPSLPQLEVLAFYVGVPVSHFWSMETLRDEYADEDRAQAEYIALRQRMIGALLQQARTEAELTVDELAEAAGIDAEALKAYELGVQPVPMHELNVLAIGVKKNMNYFLETSGTIGELLATREMWKHFAELPEEMREFAANPLNKGFIEIAIMLSKMPTDKLRTVGESMLEITM